MPIKAVIFDLDGTITAPLLDFNKIRSELKIESSEPVWEAIQRLDGKEKRRAEAVLDAYEIWAAQNAEFNKGVKEALLVLDDLGIKKGIITRNSLRAWEIVKERLSLEVDAVITREDAFPLKPAPDGVVALMEKLSCTRQETILVGDYLFDIEAGRSAGVRTVLFLNDEIEPPWAYLADYKIRDMRKLLDIISNI